MTEHKSSFNIYSPEKEGKKVTRDLKKKKLSIFTNLKLIRQI